MIRLFQINTIVNSGSTGRIAEDIGLAAIAAGHKSYIAAGYTSRPSRSEVIPIGSGVDRKLHGLTTLLFDRHGFGSAGATKAFIKKMEQARPDIIHLHNIHGYYLHIGVLFDWLKSMQVPVVWTLHDCWSFTGHCSFFDRVNCYKWQTECHHCPNLRGYPASYGLDQSKKNYHEKKAIFNGINTMRIVTPSNWLANHVGQSYLSNYTVQVIHNGVDIDIFHPGASMENVKQKYSLDDRPIILGVASTWDKRKGLHDFISLRQMFADDIQMVLVGLGKDQLTGLPSSIKGIERTEDIHELAALYAAASVFINPTYVDNFPTTNIEALSCGTPVITYNTGGSPEAIDEHTGFVIDKGDLKILSEKVKYVISMGKSFYLSACRTRAIKHFNKADRYLDYLDLYKSLLN